MNANVAMVIVYLVLGFVVLPLVLRLVVPLITGAVKRKRLMSTGVAARAILTSIEQTGTMLNQQPQCRIGVRVEPAQGPAFDATVTQIVLLTQIPQFQPGRVLSVRYDPARPADVAIVSVQ